MKKCVSCGKKISNNSKKCKYCNDINNNAIKNILSLLEIPNELFILKNNKNNTPAVKKIINNKKKIKIRKKILLFSLLIISLSIVTLLIYSYIKSLNLDNTIYEDNITGNKIFEIGDKITYKKVNYTVLNVETSNGTKYRKPKKDNHFLIVTIKIENESDNKIKYSYENWKMINSLENETSRIVTAINAGKSLTSGSLVSNGEKIGSLVFEEPIGDENLQLKFYELSSKSDTETEQNIKLIFRVNIKVNEKVEN